MRFIETPLEGAYAIELEAIEDERGYFARTFCTREFESQRLVTEFVQCSISYNRLKGTIHGMHYQNPPGAETKLVRCTRGAVFDVMVDIRRRSPSYREWYALELTAENRMMLYIPEGFAHGFQTLVDDTEVFYQISEYYIPECALGLRWDDPALKIEWPLEVGIISNRDRTYRNMDV